MAGEQAAHLAEHRRQGAAEWQRVIVTEQGEQGGGTNTQLMAYESGVIFLVSRKEQSSGSWYCRSSLYRWNGRPFTTQSLKIDRGGKKKSQSYVVCPLSERCIPITKPCADLGMYLFMKA